MSAVTPVGAGDLVKPPPTAVAGDPPIAGGQPPAPSGLARRVLRQPVAATALTVLVGIVAACAAAPVLAPYGPDTVNLTNELAGPSFSHLLGTDELGRDVLSRLLYGGQSTLLAAAEATAIAVALGVVLGVTSGYFGRWTDRVLALVTDVLLTVPVLVVLIVVVSVFPGSPYPAMIPLGVLLAAAPVRVLRSVTMQARQDLYVEAARVSGRSHWYIMSRHILPRIRGPVIVQATLVASVSILLVTGLAFLGFGVVVPAPSWGSMVAEAATEYQRQPWFLVPTGGVIAITVLCLGLVGDAVRDAVAAQWTGARQRGRNAGRVRVRVRHRPPGASGSSPDSPIVVFQGGTDVTGGSGSPGAAGAAELVGDGLGADRASNTGDDILQVRKLTVTLAGPGGTGATTLVDGVSFDVRRGKTLAIVGESGCGKSLTARAILGVVPAGAQLSGSVYLAGTEHIPGRELVGAGEAALQRVRGRRIAFVGQEPVAALDPTQTVGSALGELIRLYRRCDRAEARRSALELLMQVRLDDPERIAKLYPHQLSGGMAQRVTIARALAGRPEVLVADEPTTALDVTVQADVLALLHSLQVDTGIAVVLVTHDWGVVAGLADEVLVMYAGQAVERADVHSVFEHPRHPYTDALLRSDPHRVAAGSTLPVIAGSVPPPGSWPVGCRFAQRCPLATDQCRMGPIAMADAGEGHRSRCVHIDQVGSSS